VATEVKRSALLPFPAASMFAIVNDVASYPEFLPWCAHAEVVNDGERQLVATLELRGRGLKESFTTRNTYIPNERIDLELVSGPFTDLSGVWQFTALGDAGCRVELNLQFQFSGVKKLLGGPFSSVFTRAADQLVDAFCVRAQALLG
jgi:ribosome-associated toxin RatA of RatAB toxin-antitoxin module